MPAWRDVSIRRKLQIASMLASLSALIAASVVFIAYDVRTFRELLLRRILLDAQIVGFNSVTPLLFNDPSAASSMLAALKAEPHVRLAALYRKGGPLFASYLRDRGAGVPPALSASDAPATRFDGGSLTVVQPVTFEGERVGTILIVTGLAEIRERVWRYVGITVIVLGGGLFVAALLSGQVHKMIARPILHLASTASAVSAQKDYSVRAVTDSRDEIGGLIRTFNEMLAQIQEQDTALRNVGATLEQRVHDRTRELEAFQYSVSHDLRAPLRAIDGFSRTLLEEYSGKTLDEKGSHYLRRVRANTQRMGELIDDLLHLSRVTNADLVRRAVDVSESARAVAAELAARDPARDVDVQIAAGLATYADPHLLRIVFENLLGNAWKFTGRCPTARIEVGERVDGRRAFFVKDNGAGFDMAYANKLFGVFQRLHSNAEFDGTGIGLATVQRIVSRHDGCVWAESAVGQGATFFFTLGETP